MKTKMTAIAEGATIVKFLFINICSALWVYNFLKKNLIISLGYIL